MTITCAFCSAMFSSKPPTGMVLTDLKDSEQIERARAFQEVTLELTNHIHAEHAAFAGAMQAAAQAFYFYLIAECGNGADDFTQARQEQRSFAYWLLRGENPPATSRVVTIH